MAENQRISLLSIRSEDDPGKDFVNFNPADFKVTVPNTTKMTGVTRLCHTMISVPRMFDNITEFNNEIRWYQRQVREPPTNAPNIYLRTVDLAWTNTKRLLLTTGQRNIAEILAEINAFTGPNEVWSFVGPAPGHIQIDVTPTDPPIVFGEFFDGAHVEPPVTYANMMYVTGGAASAFDTLGLLGSPELFSAERDPYKFDQKNPDTFDARLGSNLHGVVSFPLFNRSLFLGEHDQFLITRWREVGGNGRSLIRT